VDEAHRAKPTIGAVPFSSLVERLAAARIGETFNQYASSPELCARLDAYLAKQRDAPLLLVGEAAGYRGARISGLPFTSECQVTGAGPSEATATIVHRVLAELGLADGVLLWNVVPTHPQVGGDPQTNRTPTRAEVEASLPFLAALARGRRAVPVGRLAHGVLGGEYVRHPSHGGARGFRDGLRRILRPST
jgi:uracil-DNA glycosylase